MEDYDEEGNTERTFKCDCYYPCDEYPGCGGTKITMKNENSTHGYTEGSEPFLTNKEEQELLKSFTERIEQPEKPFGKLKDPIQNAILTLAYRCLQWEDGEIKGFDMQMMESLLPIIMKDETPKPEEKKEREASKNQHGKICGQDCGCKDASECEFSPVNKQLAELRVERDKDKTEYKRLDDKLFQMSLDLVVVGKERNELKAERDKLKEELESCEFSRTDHYVAKLVLEADNERLKEANDELETTIQLDKQADFTSELQRRWPSDEEISKEADKQMTENRYLFAYYLGFLASCNWLKSYLENK